MSSQRKARLVRAFFVCLQVAESRSPFRRIGDEAWSIRVAFLLRRPLAALMVSDVHPGDDHGCPDELAARERLVQQQRPGQDGHDGRDPDKGRGAVDADLNRSPSSRQ